MPLFIVRVELHNIDHSHPLYAKLHTDMESNGYARVIKYHDDKFYRLPSAEYTTISDRGTDTILDTVKAIANKITAHNGVMVTKSAEFLQKGLLPSN